MLITSSLAVQQHASKLLRKHEGYEEKLYEDSEGNPTIGVGFNLAHGLYPEEIDFILHNRIDRLYSELSSNQVFKHLDTVRKVVLIDIAYNTGVEGLKKFKKMWAALTLGDYNRAADEILDSQAARDLPSRYSELAKIMRSGQWSNDS